MKLYEEEFNKIKKSFSSELKQNNHNVSYAIIGSPLMKSKFLLVGTNWGGDISQKPQSFMPLVNDILVESTNPTYSGYINFFTELFKNDKSSAIQFINSTVYLNGNFIRTPNQKSENKNLIAYGEKISRKYLKQLIQIIEPTTIICFGNGDNSGTEIITKVLLENENIKFWELNNSICVKTGNNMNTYHIKIEALNNEFEIFSFPHSSRYKNWKYYLSKNDNFKKLQKRIFSTVE